MSAILLSILIQSSQPACGAYVVAISSGDTLVLYDRDGAPAARIATTNRRLPVALPVAQCGNSVVLVRYGEQVLTAKKWQLVYEQRLDICPATVSGSREGSMTAGDMLALDKCGKKRRGRR